MNSSINPVRDQLEMERKNLHEAYIIEAQRVARQFREIQKVLVKEFDTEVVLDKKHGIRII